MKNLIRKILLSVVFCFALISAKGQYVTIPDPNFENWLYNNGFASCMNGNQMDTTCLSVINATSIDCSMSNIYDLTGISYFDNLTDLNFNTNQIFTLPSLPASLTSLICNDNYLTTLPALPVSLRALDCSDNDLSLLPTLPDSLYFLSCQHNHLATLPTLPPSLVFLYCNYNYLLTSLPALPPTLSYLACSGNQLTVLPTLPGSLINLFCWGNQLSSLPTLPASLTYLICYSNQLTQLPSLPSSLVMFDCSFNQLTALPVLPSSIVSLKCYLNQLSLLPALPGSLREIDCSNNQLSLLPSLPDSLTNLNCNFNQLTTLPFLPALLTTLGCSYNLLTTLPDLPDSLVTLGCNNNQLNLLPSLPSSINILGCSHNQLTSIPALPDSMDFLYVNNNSALSCLPEINSIDMFRWDSTNISCLPNVITIGNSATPPVNLVPICQLINQNGCSIYWNISGRVYADGNMNCIADTNEYSQSLMKLKLFENGMLSQQTFTNGLGQYSFDADTGTYTFTIDTVGMPFNINCPGSGFYVSNVSLANQFYPNKDFSVECNPGFDVGVSSIINSSGRFRPADSAIVNILAGDISNHYNLHCATGVNGTVTVIINGPASFSSVTPGALTPAINGNTLLYTIADFGTVNFQSDFSFIVQTDTTAQAGDSICFDVAITPLAGDNNTANNNYTQCFTVRNSYDPNQKEVYPSGLIDTSQHYLTYTIYFQNTGNDTALHVYVLDTLDNAIDESSIQLLSYSHEPLVQVMGNVVKLNFPNINLVDSVTNEPHSHGFVQYRVRLNDGLIQGTVINNTAHIYFDFNTPVVTNTTFNQVDIFTSIATTKDGEAIAEIYPNPIANGGELKIVFNAADVKHASLNVYDMSGRKVFEQSITSSAQTQSVRLPFLAPGIYQCVMDYGMGNSRKKLVVAQAK